MQRLKAVIHSGKMADCRVCTPEDPNKRKRRIRREEKPKHINPRAMNIERSVRTQMAVEIGDEEEVEISRDERFSLLQKYGIVAPRIDRRIKRPIWMGGQEWNRKLNAWNVMTKGLLTQFQSKKNIANTSTRNPHRTNSPRGNFVPSGVNISRSGISR